MKVPSYPEQYYSEYNGKEFIMKLGSSNKNDIRYVPSRDDDTVSIDGTIYRIILTQRYNESRISHRVRKVLPLN